MEGIFSLNRSDSLEVETGESLFKETKKALVLDVERAIGKVTGNVQLHLEGLAVYSEEFGFYSKFNKKPWGIFT